MTLWCCRAFLFIIRRGHMPPHSSPLLSHAPVKTRAPDTASRLTGRLATTCAAISLIATLGSAAPAAAETPAIGPMASLADAKTDAIGQIINATSDPSTETPADEPADAAPAVSPPIPQDAAALPDAATLDWSPLQTDPAALIDHAVAPPATLKRAHQAPLIVPQQTEITRQRASASGTELSVEKPLPVDFNMKVGADMDVHAPMTFYTPHRALGATPPYGASEGDASAKAWASLSAPGFSTLWDNTKIKASVDPQNEKRSFETSLVKSVPLGDQLKIVVENSYKANQPLTDNSATGTTSHGDHAIDQRATLTVLSTDTSLTASNNFQASSEKWLKKIAAEQKVFGGVSVTGSLGQTTDGDINKSIGAAYKRNW